ncbi:serine hydrolase domain-containing protein [Asaia sp. HN010]|uniref:serine hydrolase domain-containing protein n=1 Tax=Asaia sp. HN010 TaxID=3081233 RepID=UPI00301B223D
MERRHFAVGLGAALLSTGGCATSPFLSVDRLIAQALRDGKMPGAILVIGHRNIVVHRSVTGYRALAPEKEKLTLDTVFDMASLTKPLITALCVMQLVEEGKLSLDTKISALIPDFAANGKDDVTLRLLLTHYSGLPPDLPLSEPWHGRNDALRLACASPLVARPGSKFIYSDINFIVFGMVVEIVSGNDLQDQARHRILSQLSMSHSGFLPAPRDRRIIAPTQYQTDGTILRGIVHDPSARRMGGVAGHAGLFARADDLVRYITALIARRSGQTSSFPLSKAGVMLMTTPQQPAGRHDLRGLGWDIDTHYSSLRGAGFPLGSFGHTGFTGPSLWIAPESGSFVLILTNRVHPNGGTSLVSLRRSVSTEVARILATG